MHVKSTVQFNTRFSYHKKIELHLENGIRFEKIDPNKQNLQVKQNHVNKTGLRRLQILAKI